MSFQLPPNPILTTYQYWNWLNVDEATRRQRALDNNYMMFPTAQNYPTFFSKLFFITDVALTKMANTAYVIANIVPYLASLPPLITSTTWLAIQNFTTIETDTINPIGAGTLTIGSGVDNDIRIASQNSRSVVLHLGDGDSATSSAEIHINNGSGCLGNVEILHGTGSTGTITLGTRRTVPSVSTTTTTLNCPLTPMYSYPIIPVGAIGYRAPITFLTNGPLVSSSGAAMRSCSVTQGTWLIYFFVNASGVFVFNFTVEIQTGFGRRGTVTVGSSSIGSVQHLTTIGGMTYFSSSQTVNFRVRNDSGGSLNAGLNPTSNCVAYRIA